MFVLLLVFTVALGGMVCIPLRHIPRVRTTSDEELAEQAHASVVRAYLARSFEQCLRWYHHSAKNMFLRAIDHALKFFERIAGKIAGSMKHWRMLIQERFRVIPRESSYWRQIHSWKHEHGALLKRNLWQPEYDITYHYLEHE